MSRRITLALAVSLSLSALAAPALAFDVAFDVSRLFLRYTTAIPFSDTGAIPVPAGNNASHPMTLPCNMDRYGVQIDARYLTGTTLLYPQLQSRYYALPNTLVWSNGYEFGSPAPFSVDRSNVDPFNVGQTAVIGQTSIDATDPASRPFLFQPSDLPPNVTVRHALHVSLYSDPNYSVEVNDDAPANNNVFVYLRRSCPN